MNFDYHMHTSLSDGSNTHEEMVLSAISKGMNEIGFSDHFCIKHPVHWAVNINGIPHLRDKIDAVRQKYAHKINILFGLEVDYFPDQEEQIAAALEPFDFDYIMGSVHFLDDWNYDSDRVRYSEFDNDFLYRWYFTELQKAAVSGLFDTMSHPDLIKKFKIWPSKPQTKLFEETAQTMAEAKVAFEINTSGKDRPCGEFFPNKSFLNILCKAGVPVTLGSDSHKAEQIGRHFDQARHWLAEAGYKSVVRYKKRERIETLLK